MKTIIRNALYGGVACVFSASTAYAGWLSDAEDIEPALAFDAAAPGTSAQKTVKSAKKKFDIVVSLHNNPQGDDEYPEEPSPATDDDDQNKYERLFEHFADAVCEQTNKAHKIGTIRVFRQGRQAKKADILWKSGAVHPSSPLGAFGKDNANISFGDSFSSFNFPADAQVGGYILGHEWGHYAYTLLDEYEGWDTTNKTNTAVANPPKAAMNVARNAASSGDFTWLNHSTSSHRPYRDGNPQNTEHGVIYGKSVWETLVQDPKNDPKGSTKPVGGRIQYTELTSVAPTVAAGDTDKATKNLTGDRADCRSELDIVWLSDNISLEIIIDRSGSMSGTPIDNAKVAAKRLVDVTEEGKTNLGVASFSSSVRQDFNITPIPKPDTGVKSNAKTAIDGISASGSTALYDAAVFGLNQLNSFASSSSKDFLQATFLLSDGGDNASSETEGSVISKYQAADTAVFSFGYGSGAPGGTLRNMAEQTGGEFFSAPTSLAAIQAAFERAKNAASDTAFALEKTFTVPASDTVSEPVVIDSSVANALLSLSYTGSAVDTAVKLLAPDGSATGISVDCNEVSGETSCIGELTEADVTNFGTGTYTVEITNNSGSDLVPRVSVVVAPKEGEIAGTIALRNIDGTQTIQYPEPMLLSMTVSKEFAITGVDVSAEIDTPSGGTQTITFVDDGTGGDAIAGDGIYTALFSYTDAGTYTVRVTATNDSGQASFTDAGLEKAKLPSGATSPPLPTIDENFSRAASLQIAVEGFASDDHADDPAGGSCTGVTADNSDTPGRIDAAGDMDCFAITGFGTNDPLVVRVTGLVGGMDPELIVFASDGATEIGRADMSTTDNSTSGVILQIAASDLDTAGLIAKVQHVDDTADQGQYDVSAGGAIFSDTPPPAQQTGGSGGSSGDGIGFITPGGDSSGLAIGPMTLLGLLLAGAWAWWLPGRVRRRNARR